MSTEQERNEIAICMGSSCFSRGNTRHLEIIKEYLAAHGLEAHVELVGHLCEGQCKQGPNLKINGKLVTGVESAMLPLLLEEALK
jgi:NADH:ubiquinone oxidoreductase subunit E